MAVIRVPKPPRKAFDPQRPAGTLLQSQLKHLEWAVRPAAARKGKAFTVKPAKTEAEAAARIAKLSAKLHLQATALRDVMPPNPDPSAERPATLAVKRTPKARAGTARKPKSRSRSRRPSKRRGSR
jgi:hypothetical protein